MGRRDELGDGLCGPDVTLWPSRPRPAGGTFAGILVTDRYSAYNWYPCGGGSCAGRICSGISQRCATAGTQQRLGKPCWHRHRQMFTWWHLVREGTLQRSTFRSVSSPLRREVSGY